MNVLVLSSSEGIATGLLRCLSLHDARPSVFNVWDSSGSTKLSRYCRKYYSQPLTGAAGEVDRLIEAVNQRCRDDKIDLVLPAGILGTFVLAKIAKAITQARVFPVPSTAQICTLHNKWLFHQLLIQHGIPALQTRVVANEAQLASLEMPYPLILKPLSLGNSEGVRVVKSRDEAARYLSEAPAQHLPVLAQEFAPGDDLILGVFARDGELKAWTLHQRLPHFLRFFRHDGMVECARKIIAAIGYNGVGNFDFRFDESTGKFAVLECNPRFWASAPVSIYYGVDFLKMGMLAAHGEEIPADFKTGVDSVQEVPYPTPRRYLTGLLTGRYKLKGSRKNLAWRALVDPIPTIKEIIWDKMGWLNILDSDLMEKMFEHTDSSPQNPAQRAGESAHAFQPVTP